MANQLHQDRRRWYQIHWNPIMGGHGKVWTTSLVIVQLITTREYMQQELIEVIHCTERIFSTVEVFTTYEKLLKILKSRKQNVSGDTPCQCNRKCTGFQCTTSLENQVPDAVNKSKSSKVFRKIIDILSEMTNFSLFTDPLFLMYAISCTLTMFGEFFASKCPKIINEPFESFLTEKALTHERHTL